MKQNILVLLTIERDLKKFGCVAKIDSFFISQIRLRVLTTGEQKRYLRKKAQHDFDYERNSRRAARAQTAHRNANRSALDLTELDDAAGDRNISGDEEDPDSSDTESEASHATAKWSWCSKSELVTNDTGSARDRRFFFRFIRGILSMLRHIESSNHYQNNSKNEGTDSFKTETENSRRCLVNDCNAIHKNKQNKPSQNLFLCKKFQDMTLGEKKTCAANVKACFNCLTPGHLTKDCKSKVSCRNCKKKHHSSICNDNSKNKEEKSKGKSKPQDSQDKNVETLKTESISEPKTGIADIEDITENNMRRCYELTSAEIYFMSRQDRVSRNLTCVGSVKVKGPVTADIIQTMSDVCSTDNWLVIEYAQKLGAKKVGEFQGIVKTINGHERSTLPKYEVRVQMSDKNWTKIHCLGVKSIGWKPQI